MAKRYIRINWQNAPSTATPRNAENLNIMDKGIKDCDDAIGDLALLKTTAKTDLVAAINEQNNNLVPKTIDVSSYLITDLVSGTMYVDIYGKIAVLRGSINKVGVLNGQHVVTTAIPQGCRPVATLYGSAAGRNQGAWAGATFYSGAIQVNPGGTISFAYGININNVNYINFSIPYLLQ